MEQQAEIVAAAEAVRTWVLAQRAGWAGGAPLPRPAGHTAFPGPLPSLPEPDLAPDLAPDDSAAAAEEPLPEVAVPSLAPFLRVPEPITSVYVEAPRPLFSGALFKRAAVVLATLGILGSGGFAAWKRYAAMPRGGTAVIESTPSGSDVLVDGRPAGKTPLRVELSSGRHQLQFRLKGQTRTEQVTVARGADTPVRVDWTTRPTGVVQVVSTPVGARVTIDGRERGVTPLEIDDIPAGAHVVEIESAEEGSVRRRIDVGAGRTEIVTEAIYPGWIHVSAPFDVVVAEGRTGIQLDATGRALVKPGPHTIRIASQALGYAETREITVEPGDVAEVDIASPTSTLTVTGPAGAEVFVDGEKVGQIPLAAHPVKLGSRDVTVVEPSGARHQQSVTVTSRPVTIDIAAR